MENSAYIALSGQSALKRKMSVVANNLANMNTTAYKTESMMFVEHLVKSRDDRSFIPKQIRIPLTLHSIRTIQKDQLKTLKTRSILPFTAMVFL